MSTTKSHIEWLCNDIKTLILEEFHQFIQDKVEIRRNEFIANQNIGINFKDEFAD